MTQTNTATSNKANGKTAPVEHPVSDQVTASLHKTVDAVGKKAAGAETAIRQGVDSSADKLSTTQDELKQKWDKSSVKQYAVENPVATAGIAFAAGALIASLVTRKS